MRKHSLEVTHGDYRRESFHCEHSLQSLLEMEGENGPVPPSPSSSSSPSPPTGAEMGGLKPARRLGRQESPLSRDTLLTGREKDTHITASEAHTQSIQVAPKAESKARAVDTAKTPLSAETPKSKAAPATVETKSSPVSAPSTPGTKSCLEDKPPHVSTLSSETTSVGSATKAGEKGSTLGTSKGLQPQDRRQQSTHTQTDSSPAAKALEKTEVNRKGDTGADKVTTQRAAVTEVSKPSNGTETGDSLVKGGVNGSDKAIETTRVKGPAPPVPTQTPATASTISTTPVPVVTRSRAEKVSGPSSSYRGAKEERAHLEVLEENPMSPSSTAASPCSSKSRPVSPGDKASFVTQLTCVAKTVLGPMKVGSQEGAKGKESPKTSEERREGSSGKSEASSGASRRGAQTASSGAAGSAQSDKKSSTRSSSKHHS